MLLPAAAQKFISALPSTATVIATDWAAHFYGDLLSVEKCEFRHRPIRFWLISFARSSGNEELYAIVLPNGTIVEPHTLRRS